MNEPIREPTVVDEIVPALGLQIGADDQAFGEILGNPVTVTVLSNEPPALLFAFRIQPAAVSAIEMPADVMDFVRGCSGEVSIENDIAWLSLDNLTGKPLVPIAGFVYRFAVALAELGLRVPEGCLRCGTTDGHRIVYADRRATRLCEPCRIEAEEEVAARLAAETRPHVGYAAGVPFVLLYVCCAWAVLWFCVELYVEANKGRGIGFQAEDRYVEIGLMFLVGAGMGWPMGVFLRRSGLATLNPWVVGSIAVLFACLVGEWIFINAMVVRQFGVVDVVGATRSFLPFVTSYNAYWVSGKILVAAAILVGCGVTANVRTKKL